MFLSVVAGMPSVEEVCQTFGLQDVSIDYTDADYQNLTTYKLFQQHVRPILAKENPKVFIMITLFLSFFANCINLFLRL